MKKIGIIGIGSPLRKDDGIGLLLLNRIKKIKDKLPSNLEFIDGGTRGMSLIHIFSHFDVILILDAINFGGKVGETSFFEFDKIKVPNSSDLKSTHSFDIFKIISISKRLYEKPSKIYIFGVQPKDTSYGLKITKELKEKVESITKKLITYLKNNNKFICN